MQSDTIESVTIMADKSDELFEIAFYRIEHDSGRAIVGLYSGRPSVDGNVKYVEVARVVFSVNNYKPRRDEKFGEYYLPFAHYMAFVDLLRNEKPVWLTRTLTDFKLFTAKEAVGEAEEKTAATDAQSL